MGAENMFGQYFSIFILWKIELKNRKSENSNWCFQNFLKKSEKCFLKMEKGIISHKRPCGTHDIKGITILRISKKY